MPYLHLSNIETDDKNKLQKPFKYPNKKIENIDNLLYDTYFSSLLFYSEYEMSIFLTLS